MVILIGLWLVLWQFCPAGSSATMSQTAFEEMLPEDTMVYLSVPDATELVRKFKDSNGYKILREVDPITLMSMAPEFQRAKALYSTYFQPLTDVFHGRIALAVKNIPPAPGIPGMILLADVDGRKEQLQQYLKERIHPLLTKAGVQMLSFRHGEYDVQQLSFAKPIPLAVCYAIADNLFIATVGRQTIQELLDGPKRERSLADSELFQEVRRKVGEDSDILAYANVSTLLDVLAGAVPAEPKAWLKSLGLREVKAAGIGMEVREAGLKQTFFLYTGPERMGLLNILAREAAPLKVVEYIPEDTTYFWSFSLGDFAERWDEGLDTLREVVQSAGGDGEWRRIVARLQRAEIKAGFKIKEDLLSPFAGELCVAVKVPEVMGVPPMYIFIEVKDAEKAKAVVEKLMGALERAAGTPIVRTTEEYKGVGITSFSLPLPGGRGGVSLVALPFMRPAFAIVGDFLVVGIHSRLVKKIVDVHGGGKSMKDDPAFNRVLANVSERGSMTSYVNMREVYDFVYGALGGVAAMQIGPDLVGKLGKIGQYLGCSVSRISCDEKGITYESFSESGGAEQVLLLPALAAFPLGVSKAKGNAQRAACLSNLRNLALACIMYANDHDDVLPSRLSELYPSYVSGLDVFVCPVHKGKEISEERGEVFFADAVSSHEDHGHAAGPAIDAESDYRLEIPGAKLGEIKDVASTIMILEKEPNHQGGRNAAYADGHVQQRVQLEREKPRAVPGVSERRTHIGLWPLAGIGAGRAREKARRAACLSNLHQLGVGCIMCASDHDGVLSSRLSELYPKYVADLNIFVCPVHKGKKISKDAIDGQGDYRLALPPMRLGTIKEPAMTVMISGKERNHQGGRNFAYADGHVAWVAPR
ncbi:DUF1559 domain-containing protein [bacterium]|nr:DUF1559 domain-containing protein [bacterium]